MATYKKRAGKPRTKADKDAEIEDNSTTAEVFRSLDEGASKTEAWVEKNQKQKLKKKASLKITVQLQKYSTP